MSVVTWLLRGRLLVATPDLDDPNFARTVILVLEHNDDGAVGVVLNRPTDSMVDDALPAWAPVVCAPAVVFVGGPVQPEAAIGIGRRSELFDAESGAAEPGDAGLDLEGFAPLFGNLGTVDLDRDPAFVVPAVDQLRVFVGYAGWAEGQLERELASNGWFVVDAEPGDVGCVDPDGLWRSVLRRQHGQLRVFADFPLDPTSN